MTTLPSLPSTPATTPPPSPKPTPTRQQSRRLPQTEEGRAIMHVLSNVMSLDLSGPNQLLLALTELAGKPEDLSFYHHLVYLTAEQIDELTTTPTEARKTKPIPLSRGYKTHIRRYNAMYEYYKVKPGWVDSEVFNTTREHYLEFSEHYVAGNIHTAQPANLGQTTYGTSTYDPVVLFEKSLKRDPRDFPSIKELRQWARTDRSWIARAKLQGISNILDHDYSPSPSGMALFEKQNEYFYSVLDLAVNESALRAEFNKADIGDGQDAYRRIKAKAETSTAAQQFSQKQLMYLTTARLADGGWKGTHAGFIIHYADLMRKHEEFQPSNAINPSLKLQMIQRAVKGVPHLESVQSNSELWMRMGRNIHAIDFDAYVEVLTSAAETYDDRNSSTSRTPHRHVMTHDVHDDDVFFDIDTDLDIITANMHNSYIVQYSEASRIPNDAWGQLSDNSRSLWQQIPIDDRKRIMGTTDSTSSLTNTSSSSSGQHNNRRPRRQPPGLRKVYFGDTDTLTEDTSTSTTDHDFDLVSDIESQYGVDFDTLYVAVADRQKSKAISEGRHPRHQPSKRTPNNAVAIAPPGDVRRLLADNVTSGRDIKVDGVAYAVKTAGTTPAPTDINLSGITYSVKMADMATYQISSTRHNNTTGALVDRGANGGIAGEDCRIIESNDQPQRFVNVEGIDGHIMSKKRLVTAGAVTQTNRGPVILIMHQYAYSGKGHSIHSSPQLEWNAVDVDEKSKLVGGRQCLRTLDGFQIPLNIRRGLPYIEMRPFRDDEWDGPNQLPHVFLTQEADWDPRVLDLELSDDPEWFAQADDPPLLNPHFDVQGDYRHRVAYKSESSPSTEPERPSLRSLTIHDDEVYFDAEEELDPLYDLESTIDRCVYRANLHRFVQATDTDVNATDPTIANHHGPRKVTPTPRDYEQLRPMFAWLPDKVIEKTFGCTTQYARMPHNTVLRKRFKAPNPALNIHQRGEPLASDTIESDTPAIDGGEKYAQFFVGTRSQVCDVAGLKRPAGFPGVLADNITMRGAPTKLITDSAKVETSNKVRELLRTFGVNAWQSEPYHQHQNPAERRYQDAKRMCNTVLDRSGAPAYCWLLCLQYVCLVLNHCFNTTIGTTPLQYLLGSTNDISQLLYFEFYEPVYYHMDDTPFPSGSREHRGRWVGVSETVGNFMTFKILTDDSLTVIHRSNIRSARDPNQRNLRMDPLNEAPPQVIRSWRVSPPASDHGENSVPFDDVPHCDPVPDDDPPSDTPTAPTPASQQKSIHDRDEMTIIDLDDLVGRSFLLDSQEDGQRFRARIVQCIKDHESDVRTSKEHNKFRISVNDDEYEDVITYNELMDFIQKNEENDSVIWKFKRIVSHEGPLLPSDIANALANHSKMVSPVRAYLSSRALEAGRSCKRCEVFPNDLEVL